MSKFSKLSRAEMKKITGGGEEVCNLYQSCFVFYNGDFYGGNCYQTSPFGGAGFGCGCYVNLTVGGQEPHGLFGRDGVCTGSVA